MKNKYHYFYKITNLINNHFYYGIHSTNNLNDGYYGSGHRLHRAYKKYGINNFFKEILKYFDNREEALDYEAEIVNEELVKDKNCYNEVLGGGGIKTCGLFPVKNIKTGEQILISKDDPRYISGEYVTLSFGLTPAVDKYNNHFLVNKNDPRLLSGELKKQFEGKVCVIDEFGNKFCINKDDPRFISGELKFHMKGKILCKDKNGNSKMLCKNDPLILSGEYLPFHKGRKHSKEHIQHIKDAKQIKKYESSQKNTCWIYNLEEKINKKIKLNELDNYIKLGWNKGRKIIFK